MSMPGVDWTLFGLDGPLGPLLQQVGPPVGFVLMVGFLLALSMFVVRLLGRDS